MNISYKWIKDYLNVALPADEIADLLTFSGLEVEGLTYSDQIPEGLVVGEVVEKEKHPNADRLSVTGVDTGSGILPVVCGAPNVAVGQKVIFAPVGCVLKNSNGEPFKIKKAKIRGIESQGMICAEDEIGLGENHDGIMVLKEHLKPGTPVNKVLQHVADACFEIGLTPNRADAISHYGVARDLYAVLKAQKKNLDLSLNKPVFKMPPLSEEPGIGVRVEDTAGCGRYCGVTIKGIKVAPSPDWLQKRLRSIGLNPHNNIVDVTNFVMWECGQPLHPFDADKINGGIIVKKLAAGTAFATLDGVERKLDKNDLMICDEKGGLCIAGVLGGMKSGITGTTQNVFLESAFFDPVHIRRTSKRHALQTDASFRFERGVDPNNTMWALQRAATLIQEIAGGIPCGLSDTRPEKVPGSEIDLDLSYCDRLTGEQIPRNEIADILESLEIEVREQANDYLKLTVPSYRVDVTRPADVVEEILRIYGYNKIPSSQQLHFEPIVCTGLDNHKLVERTAVQLNALGFTEIVNNSLCDDRYYQSDGWHEAETVMLKNPVSSTLNALRQSMIFGGLEVIRYNVNRQVSDLRLFEWGKTYKQKGHSHFNEEQHLALFIYGNREDALWRKGKQEATFYDLKEIVHGLLESFGLEVEETGMSNHCFDYGLTALHKDLELVSYGLVSTQIGKDFELESPCWYADINWLALCPAATTVEVRHKSIPQYPAVRRDLSLLVDKDLDYSVLEAKAYKIIPGLLERVDLFDVYTGEHLPAGKKSYALSFVFRDRKGTLKDKTVDGAMKRLIDSYSELGAALR